MTGHSTVCPVCRGRLATSASRTHIVCEACQAGYPLLFGDLPVLVPHPERYLAEQVLNLSRVLERTRAEVVGLQRVANKYPERHREVLEWIAALRTNGHLFAELRDEVLPACDAAEICSIAARAAGGQPNDGDGFDAIGQTLALARRDWGGEAVCEAEIHRLIDAAVSAIDSGCRDPVHVLVLGAGMGRMAEALGRRYARTCAIELLLPMELLRRRLHARPVTFHIVDTRNRRLASDVVHRVDITDGDRTGESGCEFVVGDARRAPWPDASFSCVLSAYFTDVLPYSALLPEVTRLLRPGGILVHLGPLAYHHHDAGEHLAADQLASRLDRFGYSVLRTDWVTTTLRGDPSSLYEHTCHNLVLTARKTDGLARERPALTADVVLGVREGTMLNTQVLLSDRSTAILKSEMTTVSGTPIALSPLATRSIEAIDGQARFAEVVARVEASVGMAPLPERELVQLKATLERLVELGALRIVSHSRIATEEAPGAGAMRPDARRQLCQP